MTAAAVRVSTRTPHASPQPWFPSGLGISGGWPGHTINAAYYNGNSYIGFCDGDGNARIAAYNHASKTFTLSPAIVTGLGADIHCGPSVLVRSSDHKILLAVAPHGTAHMYVAVSTNAEDVTAWGSSTDIESSLTGSPTCTYANLFQLSGESGKIYLFYRNGSSSNSQLYYSTSTDGGATWAAQTELYANSTLGPYWAISSDDTSRIDFVVSDGSAGNGDTASAYHFYYTGGGFHKSDGTTLGSLPFAPANLTKIYDGATNGSVRAPYDIQTNGGNPVATWAAYDTAGSGSDEHYWYGSCSGGTWTVNQVVDVGSPPNTDFQEGGIVIDPTNPSRVFASKVTASVWQTFSYLTANSGSSWTATQLTNDSSSVPCDSFNLRPRPIRNGVAALTCVWWMGVQSGGGSIEPPAGQIRCYPNPAGVF